MHILEIDTTGATFEADLFRKEIADTFHIHSRDLRSVFSYKQLPTITPRKQGIVVNIYGLKMLVGVSRAIIFDIHSPELSRQFADDLSEKITGAEKESYFPFLALESLLSFAHQHLERQYAEMEKSTHRLFRKLKHELEDEQLELLLTLKKRINKLQISVEEIEEVISETLKDDEEIKELCLGHGDLDERIDEVESILEHAWERYEDLSHRISELSDNTDDTQEIISLKMNIRRNAIIRFDLFISLLTAILSGLAVVVGLFGMNLTNHLEGHPQAFLFVLLTMSCIGLFITIVVLVFLRRKKVW